ncbi:ATP-grasp domain-containing protein [Patescibacteria group bacterium]|nr:ATP-grasp domain-containing protein [Patescibacteria group bacterium]MBU2036500.1 ATP-grasp domain-containing protein [Patescibacteria group bacterium]
MKKKVGICFSKDFEGQTPLSHIQKKYKVYLRFLDLCQKENWDVFILTRKTYIGNGIFDGVWKFNKGKFNIQREKVKIDLVYDRTGGIVFPFQADNSFKVVNIRDFKILCWDKWKTYKQIGDYMPKTFWVGEFEKLKKVLPRIKTDWVVLKPINGLKGLGIYVGPKNKAVNFKPSTSKKYIAQEFINTSKGIPGICSDFHDLRVVVVNNKVVWSHVRIPPEGSFKANAARGGILTEVDYKKVPSCIKDIVEIISEKFYEKYDNPIFSIDFGIVGGKKAFVFEINDTIGFPLWEMKNRDLFLTELVNNFKTKLL